MADPVPAAFYDALLGWVGIYYLATGVLTLFVYGADKLAAIRGWRRVREDSLHMLSLLGGWPGAFAAQYAFRHKTRKMPFGAVYRATVLVNSAALVWLVSPLGAGWLYRMLP